ncbi:iron(III) transport system ATP-binding protein [Desulfonatronum thiosulfatophilum]|uniref:Iron(III) transport system ATP-binding protein n=1 Tax=Desulfonatronum thiosulfatophilum TaxID=617002 RepID=A0A1G6EVT5_9BACT|nr:ABC transporter ATP-binding protein [Desulfonatronum thiosulfatophilum]SDB61584.1 iron(III) transport system ATP-binding protein [Desulfonatronum thiosulfatophilum]
MSLKIEDIRHAYNGKTVLRNINLEVQSGEVICLLGPSGCGKTTLLRLIAGLEELQSGRIQVNEQVFADGHRQMPPEQRGIGFLFQDFALFPHLTVLENTMFGLSSVKARAERRNRALNALQQVDMRDFASVYPHELSGGQQQRVALARALAPNPGIMLLDEPFSSLDARLRVQIRDQTLHVLKSSGVATVMVTHDPEEAMFMGDRIVLMHQGRIIQSGSPVELYSNPINAFVTTFFSDVNVIKGTVHDGRVETDLGVLFARDIEEGGQVEIMFRPEAVQVFQDDPKLQCVAVAAQVQATRLLPGATLVHLRLASAQTENGDIHLHARVPCVFPMPEGAKVYVHVPADQFHIFPAHSSSS